MHQQAMRFVLMHVEDPSAAAATSTPLVDAKAMMNAAAVPAFG